MNCFVFCSVSKKRNFVSLSTTDIKTNSLIKIADILSHGKKNVYEDREND